MVKINYTEFFGYINRANSEQLSKIFQASLLALKTPTGYEVIDGKDRTASTLGDRLKSHTTQDTWALYQIPSIERPHPIDPGLIDSRLLVIVRDGTYLPPNSLDYVTEDEVSNPLMIPTRSYEALIRLGLVPADARRINSVVEQYNSLRLDKRFVRLVSKAK